MLVTWKIVIQKSLGVYCHWNSVKKVVVKSGSDKNVYMLAKSHLTLLFVQKAWWELAWDIDIGTGTACRLGYEVKSHIIV